MLLALRRIYTLLPVLLFTAAAAWANPKSLAQQQSLAVAHLCRTLSKPAITTALAAYQHAKQAGLTHSPLFTVIDYTQRADRKRLCTIDLKHLKLLYLGWVSHGTGSGDNFARTFSNRPDSHATSLGLYKTLTPYYGHFGYSLRLQGLEPGLNSNALSRHIVLHGATFVTLYIAHTFHSIGRSFGCFSVDPHVIKRMIHRLEAGSLLYAYYPSDELLQHSVFL